MMTLSKLEIQQMLREMNVKFKADETLEELKQRLQQENHNLWLKSVSGARTPSGARKKNLIRKRKKEVCSQDREAAPPAASLDSQTAQNPVKRNASSLSRRSEPVYRPQPIDKPAPGKPWKAAADGTEPFNRKKNVFDTVLRRARMRCEYCGIEAGLGNEAVDLAPYYILPLSQGGEHSIKNVVALCPACRDAMAADPSPKVIKDLKRKTRSKLYDSLQVVKKNPERARRHHPRMKTK
jgi:5-methylcytosine-specific restriction enzyme A